MSVGAVVIGRNEGARLRASLESLSGLSPVIYVDSGSTDESVSEARARGIEVVELDISLPFTAARARNAGLARLADVDPEGDFVMLVDGDCELVEGFVEAALSAMAHDVALVCGRRRERFAKASLWNLLIDEEWDTPVGETKACGGDALVRRKALSEVNGYRGDLIAGEEPELCYRLRSSGWRILRIDVEMTRHDAALTQFSQWWKRARRSGHAFAEGAYLHGSSEERFRVHEVQRALLWGIALPATAIVGALLISPWLLLLFAIFPMQVLRLMLRGLALRQAVFLTLARFPEVQGVMDFHFHRLRRRKRDLIEYK